MKMGKAMKKLKFWSRKKKKKKTLLIDHHPPPPPPSCQCCHSWIPVLVQPSAPPLPPWFEYDQTHSSLSAPDVGSDSGVASSSQAQFTHQEILTHDELESLYPNPDPSYQQYMVPDPVYGVPVLPAVRREKAAGVFGCVANIGRHFFRCFFPCFHIREVDRPRIGYK